MTLSRRVVFPLLLAAILIAFVEFVAYQAAKYLAGAGVFYSPQAVDRYDEYLAKRDPVLGWVTTHGMDFDRNLDASGSRIVPSFPEPGDACMSVYGSSMTWSAEVGNEDSWNNVLSQLLGCRVANYGVGGYGSDQAYLRWLHKDDDEAPIELLSHCTVTIERNVTQYFRLLAPFNEYGLKPRFILDEQGELELIPLPTFTREEFERMTQRPDSMLEHEYFRMADPQIVRRLTFPYTLSMLWAFGDFRVRAGLMRRPGHGEFYDPEHPSGALDVTAAFLARFDAQARQRGLDPVVLIIPIGSDYRYYLRTGEWVFQPLIDRLRERGVDPIHVGPGMLARLPEGQHPCDLVSRNCSGHYNAQGYRLLAESLYEGLEQRGYLKRLAARRTPAAAARSGGEG